jgi:DNA excision repair protein ERCC-2
MNVLFPFDEPRKIQKAFIMQALQVIKNKQNFMVHAPTGIGKTAASLSAALTYALQNNLTVFFLTSRHTQHIIAIETLKMIKDKHKVNFDVVDIVGKQWMCNQSGVHNLTSSEFGEYCKELRKKDNCEHYKNLKYKNKLSVYAQAALNELQRVGPCHVEKINEVCKSKNVCPFEVACIKGKKANVIIADYYHIMHPNVRENLFKRMEKELENSIIIFDEAHNLPERARSLLTTKISSYVLDNAVKEARQFGSEELASILISINDIMMELVKQKIPIDETETLLQKEEFTQKLKNFGEIDQIVGDLTDVADEVLETKKKSFLKSVADFIESWPGPEKGFVRILTREFDRKGKVNLSLTYKCLDPSFVMKPLIKNVHAMIVMSGTLTPLNMYKDLLGFDAEDTILQEYDNPFPKENKLNLIIPETSTRYTTRSKEMFETIAKKCAEIVNIIPGNCAVFFPSYNILEEVYFSLQKISTKTLFIEQPGMSKEERSDMLEKFKAYKDLGAVLLGVSSGSFGEGIDLIGDLLKSVMIVGLPLSKPDLETKELIKYYDELFGRGWDYGYIYPAIIKTMQNAGRCIRSKNDRGVVVFLDERYLWNRYFKCFPLDWDMKVVVNPETEINTFFAKNKP